MLEPQTPRARQHGGLLYSAFHPDPGLTPLRIAFPSFDAHLMTWCCIRTAELPYPMSPARMQATNVIGVLEHLVIR
jgi:hypothetical protein